MCFKTTSSSFFNRIVNLWNGLPVAIWTIYRVSLFSKKVNRFYISKDKTGLLSSAIFPIEKKSCPLWHSISLPGDTVPQMARYLLWFQFFCFNADSLAVNLSICTHQSDKTVTKS